MHVSLGLNSLPWSCELHKCYFLYIHKQICSKVPSSLYFVRPKPPSGNCYVSCFLTDKTALSVCMVTMQKLKGYFWVSKTANFSSCSLFKFIYYNFYPGFSCRFRITPCFIAWLLYTTIFNRKCKKARWIF